MEKLFISPSKYVQGEHVLQQSAEYLKELGTKVQLLTDSFVWDMLGNDYVKYLKEARIGCCLGGVFRRGIFRGDTRAVTEAGGSTD
ncbi:hypothetical protein [uncultured Enterococcus sp.]|uniref:hypothetical protein n=1 Tax=uncultured Enterococcus sp. TaxID=167972 RepID=UPI002AA657BF|nr:hypothetical protein [uncultured Enterococcus sp.]